MKICPVCCFLLGPPEEAEEFPEPRFSRRCYIQPSQKIQVGIWSFQDY